MKRLLLILVLTFSFQSLTKADDISDFQIEGMSIGDSLLDYFSEEEIKNNLKETDYTSDKYLLFEIYQDSHQLNQYGAIMIHFKKNDKNYIIYSLAGVIIFEDNFQECILKQKEIVSDISELFNELEKNDLGISKHRADKSGKSKFSQVQYEFPSKDKITIQCYDWSDEMGYMDHLRIGLRLNEYFYWIINEAHQ